MSVPALRQPKFISRQAIEQEKKKTILPESQYVIITLNDKTKLVVSSDAYNGIITVGEKFKCVFCCVEMKLDSSLKEEHKSLSSHHCALEMAPHEEAYAENLVRKLSSESSFCTICNVVIENVQLMRHLHTDVHQEELQKAFTRANTYKPHSSL